MNQIMKEDTLLGLNMSLIHKELMPAFVVGLLNWYQKFEPINFYNIEHTEPPNLFHLFEYNSIHNDNVTNLFIKSDIEKTKWAVGKHASLDKLEIDAIELFNEHKVFLFEHMIHDCRKVLDAYHLFYCYQDDAHVRATYYNPYVKEVW